MTEERQDMDLESVSRDMLEDCNYVCLHLKQSKQCDNSPTVRDVHRRFKYLSLPSLQAGSGPAHLFEH